MEMVPRRRGRPRKTDLVVKPSVTIDNTPAVSVDKMAIAEQKIQELEAQKKELAAKLEAIELANKGLTPERLASKTILNDSEKNVLQQKVRYCDLMLKGQNDVLSAGNGISVESRADLITDREQIVSQKRKAEFALKAGMTPEVDAQDAERLYRRKKELENVLRERRAGIGDEWDTRDQYEFAKTVQNKVRYIEECTNMELELRNINKILNPGDSNAGSLGYLSPKRTRNT